MNSVSGRPHRHLVREYRTRSGATFFRKLDVACHQERHLGPRLGISRTASQFTFIASYHAMKAADVMGKDAIDRFFGKVAAHREQDLSNLLLSAQ
ncbi:hypothetical protein AGR9A_Lc40101 [Agrobacterium salinitolerans str. Hayward 0363]|nr:hypothetical protein AGR9A_Lc40101 [Agrobacterium salinitolerans str. Hayward 0363]